MPRILSSRVTWGADGIDYVTTHTLAPDVTDDEIHNRFPSEHCGHHYACRAQITRHPDGVEVTQRHICNI